MRLGKLILYGVLLLTGSPVFAGELLIIQSYHRTNLWDSGYSAALNKILGKRHNIRYFEMDARNMHASIYAQRAEAAWEKYLEIKPDYVVLGDDVAIDYLGERFAREKIPVVFLGADKNPRSHFKNNIFPVNFTGVLERPLIAESIGEISAILPDAGKILVLFDNSDLSRAALDQNSHNTGSIGRVKVDVRLIGKAEEWRQQIMNAGKEGYGAIIIGHHGALTDPEGKSVAPEEVIGWTSQNAGMPLFAFWEKDVGRGKAVGGLLVDGYEHGKVAARLLIQVADGRIPDSVLCRTGKLAFSESELQRWNIQLPESVKQKAVFSE